jgi:thymidylate kinase
MVIIVEGPRGSGKSHLVDNFFELNKDPRFVYYKWNFASWSNDFNLNVNGSNIHYFSIGNILTILELANTIFKDKILVLDRSIFSSYVWAMYRRRLGDVELLDQLELILNSDLYRECNLIFTDRIDNTATYNRGIKDIFDKYEDYHQEKKYYLEIMSIFNSHINNHSRENTVTLFNNRFDRLSQVEFNKLLYSYVDK